MMIYTLVAVYGVPLFFTFMPKLYNSLRATFPVFSTTLTNLFFEAIEKRNYNLWFMRLTTSPFSELLFKSTILQNQRPVCWIYALKSLGESFWPTILQNGNSHTLKWSHSTLKNTLYRFNAFSHQLLTRKVLHGKTGRRFINFPSTGSALHYVLKAG